ncbi:hypothetical protein E1B28_009327 [Marasmius oreades]|uniref:NACHT domain-containing protein n=1 Tax=Marasmius oreades TaxID=181124 RepID=A0A9P7UT19_9AGAR|nr:uncharacterized protein E1B28_009327 [Marasmius oreades]KAG7093033.1 hypothetical protein E1B28_009327 [Marasmius oreades]
MGFKRNTNFRVNDSVVNDSPGNGNTFSTQVGDNFYHQHFSGTESGLSNLSSRVAFNALHDAEARYPQPNVLLGTREEIIGKLTHWCEDDSKSSRVYWVNGAAGVGKSAIAQALSEKYTQTGQLAAAFFFSRNDSSRDKLDPFVATIAHQLATCKALKPLIAPLIDHVVRSTPGIWHKGLEDQFRMLIQEPCARVAWDQLPRLVIIDGVDECIDVNSQKRLLRMIQNATPTLPLDFLILSRPERHISHIFSHESFIPHPSRLALGDFAESVRDDIKRYLCREFARIREEHWNTLPSPQASWPGDYVIDQLVSKATGQFIFATTTTKYIDTGKEPATPVLRLDIILHAKRLVNSSSPYPELDLLYSQILQYCGYGFGGKLQEILRLIVSPFYEEDDFRPFNKFQLDGSPLAAFQSLWALEQLSQLSQGEAAALLSGLHSILAIPSSKTEGIVVLHASFSEFLLDAQRAGVYYVGTKLSSQEWLQLLIPCRIRMLSRYCVEDKHWSMQSPPIHGQQIDRVDDGDLGSLNVWKYLDDNWTTIAVNDQVTAALSVFDPHLYLTTILHWHYRTKSDHALNFKVKKPETYGRDHIAAVRMQIGMFYRAYRRLLKISDKRSRNCLQGFFTKCKSFFRGFCVTFPSHLSNNLEKAVKDMLVACYLSICRSRDCSLIAETVSLVRAVEPFVGPDRKMIRVLPSNSGIAIPSRWEVKYIDATEGELLCKLLALQGFGVSIYPQRIMKALESTEIEHWTHEVARLDWKKTWKTYLLGKVAQSMQRKQVMGKVVYLEDEHDSECQPVHSSPV